MHKRPPASGFIRYNIPLTGGVKRRLAASGLPREPSAMNTPAPASLRRQLGLWSVVMLVVGEVIGVGIFLTPAQMTRSLGSPFWLLVVWLGMGLMALCGALCYGALAARFPEAGGGSLSRPGGSGPGGAVLHPSKVLLLRLPG